MKMNRVAVLAVLAFALAAVTGCEQKSGSGGSGSSAASSSSSGGSATQPSASTEAGGAAATTGPSADLGPVPPPHKPDGSPIVVAYSQIGAESAWRTANTNSIQSEAKKRGITLNLNDAQQKQENQILALRTFIAQKPDVIMLSPVVETGWEPVLRDIKRAGIPVVLGDRRVATDDETLYKTFIGSDFVEEGRRAGEWLAKKTNGKAVIVELQGTTGSAPANDRKKGFAEVLAKHPDMKIIFSQTGDFTRAKGKEVMEAFLKTPEAKNATALFAHNDDMALGAIQAMEEQGIKPGKDIVIVSIDGVRAAFEAMVAGKLNCTVECNPLIGPQLFDAVQRIVYGQPVPKRITVQEGVYDESQAAAALPTRQY